MTPPDWAQYLADIAEDWKTALTILGTTIVTIVMALWTLYHFLATRRMEARQPFLNKQLELYFRAVAVVGKFAALEPIKDDVWKKNEDEFWALYWSELSVVESAEVEAAMIKVGKAVKAYRQEPTDKQKKKVLENASYDLAHAIRKSISRGWRGL